MRISARHRQLERLAWAGGFFDGEGSTFAKSQTARPDYRQLNVVVPQSGDFFVPDVLTRFDEALPGLGTIGPPTGRMFKWRVSDYTGAHAAISALWPWIGPVKRDQAFIAISTVENADANGRYRSRPGRRRPAVPVPPYLRAGDATEPARLDRAWAAGFLDAEGFFGLVRGNPRVGGQSWYRIRASASQHGEIGRPAAVLRRLHAVLGVGRVERHGEPDDHKWVADGLPAVEKVLDVIGPWLGSVKREQAREALRAFRSQVRFQGGNFCKRGHPYDRRVKTKAGRVRAYCNACARLAERRIRAEQGIAPRQFRDEQRRYTQ